MGLKNFPHPWITTGLRNHRPGQIALFATVHFFSFWNCNAMEWDGWLSNVRQPERVWEGLGTGSGGTHHLKTIPMTR